MSGAAAAFVSGGGGSFAVSVSPASVGAYANTGSTANLTTGPATATASGAIGAVTWAWSQVGSSPYTWTINSPSAATSTFTCQSLEAGGFADNGFKVTATDSTGATASMTIYASANNGLPYEPSGSGGNRLFNRQNSE